jgi:hypothetical protein
VTLEANAETEPKVLRAARRAKEQRPLSVCGRGAALARLGASAALSLKLTQRQKLRQIVRYLASNSGERSGS